MPSTRLGFHQKFQLCVPQLARVLLPRVLKPGVQNLVAAMSEQVPKQTGVQYQAMMPEAAGEQVAMWDRMDDVIMVGVVLKGGGCRGKGCACECAC
eukprot:scaffold212755_cov18-Tisochrysis_lutea.AAC.1